MLDGFRNNKGFTLTELMVVVAIIGVAVGIAIPSYYGYLPHLRLKAAATDIATGLNITRMRAISKNDSMTVTFNAGTDSYANDFGDPVVNSQNRNWQNMVDIWWGAGGAKYTDEPEFTGDAVTFTSFGTVANLNPANTEYAVYLINKPPRAEEYRVKVNRLTGKVTIEQWNGVDEWVD